MMLLTQVSLPGHSRAEQDREGTWGQIKIPRPRVLPNVFSATTWEPVAPRDAVLGMENWVPERNKMAPITRSPALSPVQLAPHSTSDGS